MERLFSHIDIRVKDGARALKFYDGLLAEFGFFRVMQIPEEEPTWRRPGWKPNDEFFGFVIEPNFTPNENRIAFYAESTEHVDRVTATLHKLGAHDIDGPEDYDGYYATFFEDPDGNKYEVCYLTKHQGLTGDSSSASATMMPAGPRM